MNYIITKIIRIGLPVQEFWLLNLAISDHNIKSHIKRMHFFVKIYTYFSMCIFFKMFKIFFSRSSCKFFGGDPRQITLLRPHPRTKEHKGQYTPLKYITCLSNPSSTVVTSVIGPAQRGLTLKHYLKQHQSSPHSTHIILSTILCLYSDSDQRQYFQKCAICADYCYSFYF